MKKRGQRKPGQKPPHWNDPSKHCGICWQMRGSEKCCLAKRKTAAQKEGV